MSNIPAKTYFVQSLKSTFAEQKQDLKEKRVPEPVRTAIAAAKTPLYAAVDTYFRDGIGV
jgi:hypothetical protein